MCKRSLGCFKRFTQEFHQPVSSTSSFWLCWIRPMGGISGRREAGRRKARVFVPRELPPWGSLCLQHLLPEAPTPVSESHSLFVSLSAKDGHRTPQRPAGRHCAPQSRPSSVSTFAIVPVFIDPQITRFECTISFHPGL